MRVIFDKCFTKDVNKIENLRTRPKLKKVIEQLELADALNAIGSIKKLPGHSTR